MKLYIMLLALAGLVVSVLGRVSHQLHEYSRLSPNATGPRIDKVRNSSVTLRNATRPEPDVVRIAAVWNPNNLANDQVMATYQKKGHWLGCLLDANDAGAGKAWPDPYGRTPKSARSPWIGTLQNELRTWGWHEGEFDQDEHCDYTDGSMGNANHIGTMMTALGLNPKPQTRGGHNKCYSIEHYEDDDEPAFEDEVYHVGQEEYSSTGAYYRFALNPNDGAIFALNLLNPVSAAEGNWEDDALYEENYPQLRRASDIMSGYWLRDNPNPRNLRYYLACNVQNDETNPVIARILQRRSQVISHWPGLKLEWGEKDAEALLGSPIGATLAYMLLQHKAELGDKHVTSVTIFRDNDRTAATEVELLFTIGDVPDPDSDVEMPDAGSGVKIQRTVDVRHEHEGKNMLRVHEFRMVGGTANVRAG